MEDNPAQSSHAARPLLNLPVQTSLQAPQLWRRMACWCYEGMLLFAVVFVGDYLFSALTQTRHGLANRHPQQVFLFLLLGIYFTWFWTRGQTLAMKTWHIRLVDGLGRPVSQRLAAWRYLLAWAWFLPPLAIAWLLGWPPMASVVLTGLWIVVWALASKAHPQHQFLHDLAAGTRLVDARLRP
jgi:uncharacterized RDD family membrane protein YckC